MKMQSRLHEITTKTEENKFCINKDVWLITKLLVFASGLASFAGEHISNAAAAKLEGESRIVCTIHRRMGSHSYSFHFSFCDSIIGKSRQNFYGYKSFTGSLRVSLSLHLNLIVFFNMLPWNPSRAMYPKVKQLPKRQISLHSSTAPQLRPSLLIIFI